MWLQRNKHFSLFHCLKEARLEMRWTRLEPALQYWAITTSVIKDTHPYLHLTIRDFQQKLRNYIQTGVEISQNVGIKELSKNGKTNLWKNLCSYSTEIIISKNVQATVLIPECPETNAYFLKGKQYVLSRASDLTLQDNTKKKKKKKKRACSMAVKNCMHEQ